LRDTDKTLEAVSKYCDSNECSLYKEGELTIEKINTLMAKLRDQPMICKDGNVPGVLTVEMIEELLFMSTHSASIWQYVFFAIDVALKKDSGQLLYDMAISGKKLRLGRLTRMLAVKCTDVEMDANLSLEGWFTQINDLNFSSSILASHQLSSQLLGW
jgi:hypothetical protein